MKKIHSFLEDTRGDAVVEATVLFPIMILIFATLVLLSIYLPLRAAMQRSTQYAATAIATERSDTWLKFDPDSMEYYWLDSRSDLKSVYASVIGAIVGGKGDDADTAELIVTNIENKNIQKPSSNLTVEYGVVNYIVYKEIVVTAKRSIPLPINLSIIGMNDDIELVVTSTAVIQNGDEFIRNMDLAVDVLDDLFDLGETFSGLRTIGNKFADFLGI